MLFCSKILQKLRLEKIFPQ